MKKDTSSRNSRANGEIRIRDYGSQDDLLKRHLQIGIDDCSTDLGTSRPPGLPGLDRPDARRKEHHSL